MGKYTKGQQALEYIITYGWAFVVVLITIGAFSYFGFLNPDRYLPDRCDFGEQLECVDFLLEANDGKGIIYLKFINNFGENIVLWDVSTVEEWGEFCEGEPGESRRCFSGGSSDYVRVLSGRVNEDAAILDLNVDENLDYVLLDGEKTLVPVRIEFSRDPDEVADSPRHVIIGEVFATAQGE